MCDCRSTSTDVDSSATWCVSAHLWVRESTHLSVRVFLCMFGCRRPFCAANDDNSCHSFGVYCVRRNSKSSIGIHGETHMNVNSWVCVQTRVPVSTSECGLSALPGETPFLSELGERWRQIPQLAWPQHWRGPVKYSHPHRFPRLPVSLNCLGLFSFNQRRQTRSLERSPPITNFLSSYILGLALAPGSSDGIPQLGALLKVGAIFCWVASTSKSLCTPPGRTETNMSKTVDSPCG